MSFFAEYTYLGRDGRFGRFGGAYVPEILAPALKQLEEAFLAAEKDPTFHAELETLLRDYAGRPTSLYECRNFGKGTKARIFLKREDLLHGGAHKTNQVLGQALLARRMGKTRLIAETGAGQHGVATALAGALLGLPVRIYMGADDVERQKQNVFRMELMGAEVVPVTAGSRTLKDAVNEALRDWSASYATTHYLLGTVAGPHPFPWIVREFQRVIGKEARGQMLERLGRLPDAVVACVGGGSNAVGIFADFVQDASVALIGVEAAGHGLDSGAHGATLQRGRPGILHGSETFVLQDDDGQVTETHSISAGLDYPGVGPEHAYLQESGRASYVGVTDAEAFAAFQELARCEGILPAFESAHALAHAKRMAAAATTEQIILVNLSGRGDKDVERARAFAKELPTVTSPVREVAPVVATPVPPTTADLRGNVARYTERFRDPRALFVPFLIVGDPNGADSLRYLEALVAGGADALEVGLPFSDPVADGPVIQAASVRALAAGSTTAKAFEILRQFRAKHPAIPIGLLTYASLVVGGAGGRASFYEAAAAAGVDSVLVADVPTGEVAPFAAAARSVQLAPVLLAPPDAPAATLETVAREGAAYTYCLARAGVTGADASVAPPAELFKALQDRGAPPPFLGFGVATPAHVRAAVIAGARGVISGSAVVRIVAEARDPVQAARDLTAFVASMRAATSM